MNKLILILLLFITPVKSQQVIELCEDVVFKQYTIKINKGSFESFDISPYTFYQVDSNTVKIKYDNVGTFVLTLSSTNGECISSTDFIVEIIECNDTRIWVPSAFSPNGVNKVFRAYGLGIRTYTLLIWNRWGELIFESHDLNTGWDGYYEGRLCQNDVYPARITYQDKKDKWHELNIKIILI